MQLPGLPPALLQAIAAAAGGRRIALVGGAVRDLLRHRVHNDPWSGLPDLDLVVEGKASELADPAASPYPAPALAEELRRQLGPEQIPVIRPHGRFGTVELEVRLCGSDGWMLDIASARRETYPCPAENPVVQLGLLEDDLARRDFTVNAMALLLDADGCGVELLDPHGGQADLAERRLRFLHGESLRDDPTRLLRAARYAARLGFQLDPESQEQARSVLSDWPWLWRLGGPSEQAPAALGTRLRMELELLLEREPWPQALSLLQTWGGLGLLDPDLQRDRHWRRRLHWARRLSLPPLVALLSAASDPLALAERLQLPHGQQRCLSQWLSLRSELPAAALAQAWLPSRWCALLESHRFSPQAVALALVAGDGNRRPLLHWWWRWRHVKPPITASELMAREGLMPGPQLGIRLGQLRAECLDQSG